jgi:hypothetical protein
MKLNISLPLKKTCTIKGIFAEPNKSLYQYLRIKKKNNTSNEEASNLAPKKTFRSSFRLKQRQNITTHSMSIQKTEQSDRNHAAKKNCSLFSIKDKSDYKEHAEKKTMVSLFRN